MLVKHYNLLKESYSQRKALLDIKTHALAYLKYIPGSKYFKNEIAISKNEEEFNICIDKIYKFIETIAK